jgi:hypothetical protein
VPKIKTDRHCDNLKTRVGLYFILYPFLIQLYVIKYMVFHTFQPAQKYEHDTRVSPVDIFSFLFFFSRVLFTYLQPTILISSSVFIKIYHASRYGFCLQSRERGEILQSDTTRSKNDPRRLLPVTATRGRIFLLSFIKKK